MPAKLERCVREVMQKQGVSESRAWAICTAAIEGDVADAISIDKALAIGASLKTAEEGVFYTDSSPFKAVLDKVTGFLTAPVKLARTGVQYYYGYELGLVDRMLDKIGVYRPAEEVFHPESVKSFINLTVTDDHPTDLVNTDNIKKLQKGSVSDVKQEGDVLTGFATITDKDQIKKITNGKIEVSVGYLHELVPSAGIFDGQSYEFKQTNIRANHLAIVDAGRCGPSCRLTIDSKTKKKENAMFTVTIDGIQYQFEDAKLGQLVQKKLHDAEEAEKSNKEKMDELEEENMKLKTEKDQLQAQNDALKTNKVSDEDVQKMVSDRAILIVDARNILGDKMVKCIDCPKEMKVAVIDHVLALDLEGKSDDYIDAAYDMAVQKFKKAKKNLSNLDQDFQTKDGDKVTREGARKKYMKDHLGLDQ